MSHDSLMTLNSLLNHIRNNHEGYLKMMEARKGYRTKTISRTMLLAVSILILCYYSLRNGRTEFSILENGQLLRGFAYSGKVIMAISLGYSICYSIIYAIAAGMLIYSVVSKQPRYSLPLMTLFLAEMVSDACDALVVIWTFLGYFPLKIAMSYVAGIFLIIRKVLYIPSSSYHKNYI